MGRGETAILEDELDEISTAGKCGAVWTGLCFYTCKRPHSAGCKSGVQVVLNYRTGSSSYLTTSLDAP